MAAHSAIYGAGDYDLRSLNHERRMLAAYRQKVAAGETSFLQPLANACWRASMFEWALYRDAEAVRRLWGEAARTLAEGFARRRAGFDPNPDQLIIALHLAIAAREPDAFTQLAMSSPNLRDGILHGAHAFRASRAHFHLAEGYALVARSLAEHQPETARTAAEWLDAARHESDQSWWERQFPDPLDAAWRVSEHESICLLLAAVARRIVETHSGETETSDTEAERLAEEFARTIDETLLRLERFIKTDTNHHPKLYVWLPGLAVCALASSAALNMSWLAGRYESGATGYERLPHDLISNQQS
jgi:hypothetical protein